jgi:hypothetical protein
LFARSLGRRTGTECLAPVGLDQLLCVALDAGPRRSLALAAVGPAVEVGQRHPVRDRRLLSLLGQIHELELEGWLFVWCHLLRELDR